jgi:hypothetical protein
MKNKMLVLLLSLAIGLAACAGYNGAKAPVPGQPVNQFEAYSYTILSDCQAALAATAGKLKSGELPASLTADYDRAAVLYNTAVSSLKHYDTAFRAGSDVTAVQGEISQELTELVALGLKLWPPKTVPPAKP